MSTQHSRYGTIDLILESPDTRLRSSLFGAMAIQFFLFFGFLPEDSGFWGWVSTGIVGLSGILSLLSFTARQRTHVCSQNQTLRIERSLLRWVWRRETLEFGDIQSVILEWGKDHDAGAGARRGHRPVSVQLMAGDTLVLGRYPSAQESERTAGELARLVGCSVGNTSPERRAFELVGLETPDPLESVVTRIEDTLFIKLAPSLITQKGMRWLVAYVFGLIMTLSIVMTTIIFFSRSGPEQSVWLALTMTFLLILGGFLGFRVRARRFRPPTFQAGREQLELTHTVGLGVRRLDWAPFDSTGVSVITLRGKPALRFLPPPSGGSTSRPEPITLGRGLPEDELRWVADALRRALDGRLPSEVPRASAKDRVEYPQHGPC